MRNRNTRLDEALTKAMDAFWESVARDFREVKAGDFPPEADIAFNGACRDAVTTWLDLNAPTTAKRTASCELVVHMRPPKRGERMYMVEARDADSALEEILRESEELGYPAQKDETDARDENGMIAVTIEIRNTSADPVESRDVREGDSISAASEGNWGAFAATLGETLGWKPSWEYPGFISWTRTDAPFFICATPDYAELGVIDVQTQDTHGHVWDDEPWMQDAILWKTNRSANSYIITMRDTLAKANAFIERHRAEDLNPFAKAQKATLAAASLPGALTSLTLANYQVGEIVDQLYRYEHESTPTAIPHDKIVAAIRGEAFDDHEGPCALSQPALKPLTDYYLAMTGKLAKEAK